MEKKTRLQLPGKAFKGKMSMMYPILPYRAFLDVSIFPTRTGPKLKLTNRKEADY